MSCTAQYQPGGGGGGKTLTQLENDTRPGILSGLFVMGFYFHNWYYEKAFYQKSSMIVKIGHSSGKRLGTMIFSNLFLFFQTGL
jgi:hypothetical protein